MELTLRCMIKLTRVKNLFKGMKIMEKECDEQYNKKNKKLIN
jgi:hypothetical protein